MRILSKLSSCGPCIIMVVLLMTLIFGFMVNHLLYKFDLSFFPARHTVVFFFSYAFFVLLLGFWRIRYIRAKESAEFPLKVKWLADDGTPYHFSQHSRLATLYFCLFVTFGISLGGFLYLILKGTDILSTPVNSPFLGTVKKTWIAFLFQGVVWISASCWVNLQCPGRPTLEAVYEECYLPMRENNLQKRRQ